MRLTDNVLLDDMGTKHGKSKLLAIPYPELTLITNQGDVQLLVSKKKIPPDASDYE